MFWSLGILIIHNYTNINNDLFWCTFRSRKNTFGSEGSTDGGDSSDLNYVDGSILNQPWWQRSVQQSENGGQKQQQNIKVYNGKYFCQLLYCIILKYTISIQFFFNSNHRWHLRGCNEQRLYSHVHCGQFHCQIWCQYQISSKRIRIQPRWNHRNSLEKGSGKGRVKGQKLLHWGFGTVIGIG